MLLPDLALDPVCTRSGETPELRLLFHRLNNQLGIILAQAELLEAKSADGMNRSRAAHVVTGVLDTLLTAKEIRLRVQGSPILATD